MAPRLCLCGGGHLASTRGGGVLGCDRPGDEAWPRCPQLRSAPWPWTRVRCRGFAAMATTLDGDHPHGCGCDRGHGSTPVAPPSCRRGVATVSSAAIGSVALVVAMVVAPCQCHSGCDHNEARSPCPWLRPALQPWPWPWLCVRGVSVTGVFAGERLCDLGRCCHGGAWCGTTRNFLTHFLFAHFLKFSLHGSCSTHTHTHTHARTHLVAGTRRWTSPLDLVAGSLPTLALLSANQLRNNLPQAPVQNGIRIHMCGLREGRGRRGESENVYGVQIREIL